MTHNASNAEEHQHLQNASYYEILNASNMSSYEELKQNYKQLVLQCHPDKLQHQQQHKQEEHLKAEYDDINKKLEQRLESSNGNDDTKFVLINRAWNVLKDPIKRKQYDAELLATKFQMHSNVYAQITLADMDYCVDDEEKDNDNNEDNEVDNVATEANTYYAYNCRCGGQYIVDDSALNEFFISTGSVAGAGGVGGSDAIDSGSKIVADKQTICDKNTENIASGAAAAGSASTTTTYKDVPDKVFVECTECSLVIILKPQNENK